MPRKSHSSCSMYLYCQTRTTKIILSMPNPQFLCAGLQMVMMFLQASIAVAKRYQATQVSVSNSLKNVPAGYPKKLGSDQFGCWPVGTCAKANVTGLKGDDGCF